MIGTSLLVIGLLAYSMIPSLHTIPTQSSQKLNNPPNLIVNPSSWSETPANVSILPGKNNELVANITVSLQSGSPSSIRFKFFSETQLENCMEKAVPTGCLFDETVSNQTVRVPLNASSTYYFGLDNRDSVMAKNVTLSATLFASSTSTMVTRDGGFNFAGLGLGAVGLVVALYGLVSKTVIPWE